MYNSARIRIVVFHLALILGILFSSLFTPKSAVFAQVIRLPFEDISTVYTAEFGVLFPSGFAFWPPSKGFLLWGTQPNTTEVHLISNYEDAGGSLNLPVAADNPRNATLNVQTNSLFLLNSTKSELIRVGFDQRGLPNQNVLRDNVQALGLHQPQGITFDPSNGQLFILDAKGPRIVSVLPHPSQEYDGNAAARDGRIRQISLRGLENILVQGIAFNPKNRHLYVAAPRQQKVYEIDQNGKIISTLDLNSYGLANIQGLTFAPSADQTDDPTAQNLFVLDGGVVTTSTQTQKSGQILELSLEPTRFLLEQLCCPAHWSALFRPPTRVELVCAGCIRY
jgi:hypothetical protein